MWLAIITFLVTYFFIASEKIDKTIAALLGSACVIAFHVIPYEEALHLIDMNVIFLLIGMMLIVNILSSTGLFEWLAIKIARLAHGNGMAIMLLFMVVTAVLSAALDNVTTVILVAPITILLAQLLEIPAMPLLIMEAIFSNIGGTATLIGDPPNILIGSQTSLTFNDFIFHLAPIVAIIMAGCLVVLYFILGKKMKTTEAARARIKKSHPEKAIIEPVRLKRALIIFGCVMLGFALGRPLNIEPGIVALAGGLLMACVCKIDLHHALAAVEWNTILFFIGLFMLIGSLEVNGLFEMMGKSILQLSGGNLMVTAIAVLWFAAIASAIVDNIPLVMAMIPLVKSIIPAFALQMGISDMPSAIQSQIEQPLFWALALGACLGGNGSLIGASANVVIAQIARRNQYPVTFWQFTRYGLPFMGISLIISTAYIYLRYF